MDGDLDHAKYRFEVALSFAGDNKRSVVRRVAELLRAELGARSVFFDEWFEPEIAGPDAHLVLQRIYRHDTRLVVAFTCDRYDQKPWTQEEWRAIQSFERSLRDGATQNIARLRFLPLRFGEGEVEGLFDTAIVPDVRHRTPEQITALILERLALAKSSISRIMTKPALPSAIDSFDPSKDTGPSTPQYILYMARERVSSLFLQVPPDILERLDRRPMIAYREHSAIATDEEARGRAVRQLSAVLEYLRHHARIGDLAKLVAERGRLDCEWYSIGASFEADRWDAHNPAVGLSAPIGDYTLKLQCSKNNLAGVNREGSVYIPTSTSYALLDGGKGLPLSGLVRLAAEDRESMILRGSALYLVLEPLNADLGTRHVA